MNSISAKLLKRFAVTIGEWFMLQLVTIGKERGKLLAFLTAKVSAILKTLMMMIVHCWGCGSVILLIFNKALLRNCH